MKAKTTLALINKINDWLDKHYKNMFVIYNDNENKSFWEFRLIDKKTNLDDEFGVLYKNNFYHIDKKFLKTMIKHLRGV